MSRYRQYTPDDDAALVASWRGGEISSFEALVRKYQKRMFNTAFRITGDYEEACEVVQDAFAAAYRGIATLRGAARFSTWLTGITVSQCRQRLQQVPASRGNGAYYRERGGAGEGGEPARGRPQAVSAALERLERFALHEEMQACIETLAAEFREVIVLRDVQGFSCDAVCAILKVREGTVKSRLSRAREMVKDCLRRAAGEL
jgi:RNA polymerase sigma-70 factor, ECF subfamily